MGKLLDLLTPLLTLQGLGPTQHIFVASLCHEDSENTTFVEIVGMHSQLLFCRGLDLTNYCEFPRQPCHYVFILLNQVVQVEGLLTRCPYSRASRAFSTENM